MVAHQVARVKYVHGSCASEHPRFLHGSPNDSAILNGRAVEHADRCRWCHEKCTVDLEIFRVPDRCAISRLRKIVSTRVAVGSILLNLPCRLRAAYAPEYLEVVRSTQQSGSSVSAHWQEREYNSRGRSKARDAAPQCAALCRSPFRDL